METNARPPSVAATASLHYLQADDEPSNQTSLIQQIKTGLPKAAGNVKNIATEWLARQRQHRPSCTAKHFAFDIDVFKFNMAEGNQFRASALSTHNFEAKNCLIFEAIFGFAQYLSSSIALQIGQHFQLRF